MQLSQSKKFVAKTFESILVIGYILFEELIWNVLAKPILLWFKKLVLLESLKNRLLAMHRYYLLAVFIVILVIAEGLGLLSGYCFINGYLLLGLVIYGLKIPTAAFTFWLFDQTKDRLLKFDWLKASYDFIMDWVDKFINSALHIYIKSRIQSVKLKIKQFHAQIRHEGLLLDSIKAHYWAFKPYFKKLLNK